MGLIKKSDATGGALGKLRKQAAIHEKLANGELKVLEREALVLVMDMSPSMCDAADPADGRWNVPKGRRAWDAAVKAAKVLVDRSVMSEVGIALFCAVCPSSRRLPVGSASAAIISHMTRFDPNNGEGTCFEAGISAALDMLDLHEASRIRRIVFMTDGADGMHTGKDAWEACLARLTRSGVILDAVGFGQVEEDVLRELAARTGGVYRYAANGEELVREFKMLDAGTRGLLGSGS